MLNYHLDDRFADPLATGVMKFALMSRDIQHATPFQRIQLICPSKVPGHADVTLGKTCLFTQSIVISVGPNSAPIVSLFDGGGCLELSYYNTFALMAGFQRWQDIDPFVREQFSTPWHPQTICRAWSGVLVGWEEHPGRLFTWDGHC